MPYINPPRTPAERIFQTGYVQVPILFTMRTSSELQEINRLLLNLLYTTQVSLEDLANRIQQDQQSTGLHEMNFNVFIKPRVAWMEWLMWLTKQKIR